MKRNERLEKREIKERECWEMKVQGGWEGVRSEGRGGEKGE